MNPTVPCFPCPPRPRRSLLGFPASPAWAVWLPLLLGLLAPSPLALAQPAISYQGVLQTGDGKAVSQNRTIIFRIFDAPGAGNLIWSEQQLVQIDTNGLFNVELGGSSPIVPRVDLPCPTCETDFASVFISAAAQPLDGRYLELTIVDSTSTNTISPRQRFLYAPYALGVANVQKASGDFTVDGTLKVATVQAASTNGVITLDGNLTVDGTLNATTDTLLGKNLSVAATTTTHDLEVAGTVDTASLTVTNNLQVGPTRPGATPSFQVENVQSSPVLARMVIGDGTGWQLRMSNKPQSATNDVITFDDKGTIQANSLMLGGSKPIIIRNYQFPKTNDLTTPFDTGIPTNNYAAFIGGFGIIGGYFKDRDAAPDHLLGAFLEPQPNKNWGLYLPVAVHDTDQVTSR